MRNPPNILLIMADQFRADWLGCAGFPIHTPHIDSLAAEGIRFTRASCVCPLCTPSRAALATGKYPHNCGVTVHDAVLPADETTYYQLLRKQGYRVGAVGKTDLHKAVHYYGKNGDLPFMYHMGFTDLCETEGKMNAAWPAQREDGPVPAGPYQHMLTERGHMERLTQDYLDRLRNRPTYYAAPSVLPEEEFHDRFVGERACRMLNELPEGEPWHLFVSFVGPHDPWDPPLSYYRRYENSTFPKAIPDSLEDKPRWIKERAKKHTRDMTEEDLLNMQRHYAGAITLIDDWVGNILEALDRRGERDNTVIVFTADHGEMLGDHGLIQKSVMYESALRVPLIVSAPWIKDRGKTCDELAELFDLAPTFLELAGADYPKEDMDAVSLVPVLKGEGRGLKPFQHSELINTQMLFDGRYKWIRNFNDRDELYDLEQDPKELHNIIDRQPEVMKRLRGLTFRQ